MRRLAEARSSPTPADAAASEKPRPDSATLKKLLPYLWEYRWRVGTML